MKRFLMIAAFAASLFSADFATAQKRVEDYPTVQFFAHRGSRFEYEENTMYAFETDYARGARGFAESDPNFLHIMFRNYMLEYSN